jgi:hypothetical protein
MKNSCIPTSAALAAACALAATLAGPARADSTWVGPRYSTDPAAWNVATNWDGGVPTGSAKASIPYEISNNHVLHFTPPLDFTGEIAGGRDGSTWDIRLPTYLRLTVLDGATWTVGGNGHLIATEGIAPRIASTFTGTILVPPGMAFTAPSTLNKNVEFTGKGTLTLTTTNQLSHISGFSGTLVWDGPEGASLTPQDLAVLNQRGIRLGNGASIALRDRFLAINGTHEIPDWSAAPADWSFNGATSAQSSEHTFTDTVPHVNADGSLALVDDAAQVHTAFYNGRKFMMHDSWGIHFRWKPDGTLPGKYAGRTQEWCGIFGVYLAAAPTECGTSCFQPAGRGHGFGVDYLGGVAKAGWQLNQSNIPVNMNAATLDAIAAGIDLKRESEVDVTCQNGTLTVTITQGDAMFSIQRPTFNQNKTLSTMPDGYYVGIAASSYYYSDNSSYVPMATHTISDFNGWYRARSAHGWQDVADSVYPFTASNCTARIYQTDYTYVENAAALESDGSFRLEPNGSRTRNILRPNSSMNRADKWLVSFDLVAGDGTSAENTQYTKFGFVRCNDTLGSWIFRFDSSHGDIMNEAWDGYAYPLMVSFYWYGGQARFWGDCAGRSNRQFSPYFSTPKVVKNTTTHVSMVYDGNAGVYLEEHSGTHSLDEGWVPPAAVQSAWFGNEGRSGMFFQISHGNTWGQVDTVLKNFAIKKLVSADTAYVGGEIAVDANATATLLADASSAKSATPAARGRQVSLTEGSTRNVTTDVAGTKVEIDSVAISGDDAGITATAATTLGGSLAFSGDVPATGAVFSGNVTFANGVAEIVVPDSWRAANDPIPLFTLSSTSSGTLPSGYTFKTDAGDDITDKAHVTVSGTAVSVCFKSPFVLIMR